MNHQTCKSAITDDKQPRLQHYCGLPVGHSGKCMINAPRAENLMLKPERCDVISPTNKACGLPKGHRGPHTRSDGHATAEIW